MAGWGAATAKALFLTSGHGFAPNFQDGFNADAAAVWPPKLLAVELTAAIAFAGGSAPLPQVPFGKPANGEFVGGQVADAAIVSAWAEGQPVLVLADLACAQLAARQEVSE